MGIGYIAGGNGGGGVTSDEVTAKKENVLEGKTTVTADSDNAVVGGSMKNNGSVKHTLAINGSYTIPKGYHDGTGKVTQSIQTRNGETFYPAGYNMTVSKNQYLTGDLIVHAITQSGLLAENILAGKTITINNGKQDVWKVTGLNRNLRYWSNSSKGNGTNKSFELLEDGQYSQTYRMYYEDIAPGFTPVFVLCVGRFIMWRINSTRFNIGGPESSIGGAKNGYFWFKNAADCPMTAKQTRIFYGSYDSSLAENVWFWVFGY